MQSVAITMSTSQPESWGATTSRSFDAGEKQASTSCMCGGTAFIVQAQPSPVTLAHSRPSSRFAKAETFS